MHPYLPARAALRVSVCLVLAASVFRAVAAAPATGEFAISAAQLQSLGVTLLKLERPAAIAGMAYPARVVLPPSQEQIVSAPVDGVVDRLFVNGQENIRAGQPLLRLVSPAYGELQLKLMDAAGKARLAQQTLARERQLFSEGIIPQRRVQEAEAAERSDSARVRQIEAELRLAGADEASIRRIAVGGPLDDGLLLRARSAGLVLGVEVRPGQRIKEADALVRLASLKELWLDVQLPADRAAPRTGEISVVGRSVSAAAQSVGALVGDSQTVNLRARVTRGAERLRPGEVVQVQVPFPPAEGWALPLQSITRLDDKAYVFVRSAGGFVATPVTVLSSAGQSAQVSSPALRAGQQIATGALIALKAAWLGKGGGE